MSCEGALFVSFPNEKTVAVFAATVLFPPEVKLSGVSDSEIHSVSVFDYFHSLLVVKTICLNQ